MTARVLRAAALLLASALVYVAVGASYGLPLEYGTAANFTGIGVALVLLAGGLVYAVRRRAKAAAAMTVVSLAAVLVAGQLGLARCDREARSCGREYWTPQEIDALVKRGELP